MLYPAQFRSRYTYFMHALLAYTHPLAASASSL